MSDAQKEIQDLKFKLKLSLVNEDFLIERLCEETKRRRERDEFLIDINKKILFGVGEARFKSVCNEISDYTREILKEMME